MYARKRIDSAVSEELKTWSELQVKEEERKREKDQCKAQNYNSKRVELITEVGFRAWFIHKLHSTECWSCGWTRGRLFASLFLLVFFVGLSRSRCLHRNAIARALAEICFFFAFQRARMVNEYVVIFLASSWEWNFQSSQKLANANGALLPFHFAFHSFRFVDCSTTHRRRSSCLEIVVEFASRLWIWCAQTKWHDRTTNEKRKKDAETDFNRNGHTQTRNAFSSLLPIHFVCFVSFRFFLARLLQFFLFLFYRHDSLTQ